MDIAPTILEALDVDVPDDMRGSPIQEAIPGTARASSAKQTKQPETLALS